MNKHPKDMNADELREVVSAMSWAALDLAQHLNFTNELLKKEYRDNAYKRAEEMAYQLSNMPYCEIEKGGNIDIVFLGENGLERL